jgi:hypothetical protein
MYRFYHHNNIREIALALLAALSLPAFVLSDDKADKPAAKNVDSLIAKA